MITVCPRHASYAHAAADRDSDAPSRSDASIPRHRRSRVSGRGVNRLGRRSRAHARHEEPLHARAPPQTRRRAAAASLGGVGYGAVVGARRRAARRLAVLAGVSVTPPSQRLLSTGARGDGPALGDGADARLSLGAAAPARRAAEEQLLAGLRSAASSECGVLVDYTANVFRTPAAYTFHGTTFRNRGNHVASAPTR